MSKMVGIKFQEWGKIYNFDPQENELKVSDKVIVESDSGLSCGWVRIAPADMTEEDASRGLRKVLRKANEEDLMQLARNREKENDAFARCRDIIARIRLNMKLVSVEYLFDGSKATFYFSAEERVDFRELVKELASQLHTRIEMRQIGVRDEAKQKGAVGPCGRLLCCSTWLPNFEPVSVKMAKVQGLSLNPANISGMCGRLMCCLGYEHQNYVDGVMPQKSCGGCAGHGGNGGAAGETLSADNRAPRSDARGPRRGGQGERDRRPRREGQGGERDRRPRREEQGERERKPQVDLQGEAPPKQAEGGEAKGGEAGRPRKKKKRWRKKKE